MIKPFCLLLSLTAFTACGSDRTAVYSDAVLGNIAVDGQEGVFLNTLKDNYVEKANSSLEDGNYANAKFYGGLAEEVVSRSAHTISFPNSLRLEEDDAEQLMLSHTLIKDALTTSKYEEKPAELANAISSYECWLLEEEKSGNNASDCKESFEDNISSLSPKKVEAKEVELKKETPKAPEIRREVVRSEEPRRTVLAPNTTARSNVTASSSNNGIVRVSKIQKMPQPTLVFFDLGSHSLSVESRRKLDMIAKEYGNYNPDFIGLIGATDTSGSKEYNKTLAQKRVVAVAKYLVSRGVPEALLKGKAAGEGLQLSKTADGSKNANNRFVVVGYKKN